MEHSIVKPRLLALEITRRCRFHCRHCRANACSEPGEAELSKQQWKKILTSVADYGRCVIILTGGEPMERDDIYELIGCGRRLGLRMVMATCGYLIDDASVTRLKETGILALSFSLGAASAEKHDASRQSPGAFQAVLRAAEAAKRAGLRFQINTTVSQINVDEIPAVARLSRELGAYCFNPFILVPTGRGKEIADEILRPEQYEKLLQDLWQIKRGLGIEVRVTCGPQFVRVVRQAGTETRRHEIQGCMGGQEFGFISYCGDVQTCGFLPISAGNLVANGFDFGRVWEESRFLNEIRDLSGYKGPCRSCEYLAVCRGCRARAYAMTGDYLGSDPICSFAAGGVDSLAFDKV